VLGRAGDLFPERVPAMALFVMTGDVRAGSPKRVASAVGEGSVVITHVYDHLTRGPEVSACA